MIFFAITKQLINWDDAIFEENRGVGQPLQHVQTCTSKYYKYDKLCFDLKNEK